MMLVHEVEFLMIQTRKLKGKKKYMESGRGFGLVLKGVIVVVLFLPIVIGMSTRSELSEFKSLIRFLRAVDPEIVLKLGHDAIRQNPCLDKWKGLKCNSKGTTIVGIRLENVNLRGVIDADSLCNLPNLRVLSLAENQIRGTVPNSMLACRELRYLNLSNNLLSGKIPRGLTSLKNLRKLDISENHFEGVIPNFDEEFKRINVFSTRASAFQRSTNDGRNTPGQTNVTADSSTSGNSKSIWSQQWLVWIVLFLGLSIFLLIAYILGMKAAKLSEEKATLKTLQDSPGKTPLTKTSEEAKPEKQSLSELVFFVEEEEKFKLEELLEAAADLRSQSYCSTLYTVALKNNAIYAVKRLKKIQIPFMEFGQIMRQIGEVKHDNILPLVAYNSTPDDKLLIYKYQNKGSLLNLIEDYIEGKREFPLELRLSIAEGIAKGLKFIYHNIPNDQEIVPHGNLKPSNILLGEDDEALISEFGYLRFLDPKRQGICATKGYTPPEKGLTEKGDVYSFGVILLELLTGKAVERTGLDLPKWVNAMVREEWTGEVFDRKLAKSGAQWAFPLLNIALKCVSYFPENRPTVVEVLEKIDEVTSEAKEHSTTRLSSSNECQQECCLLHSIIPETWDSPGSNY